MNGAMPDPTTLAAESSAASPAVDSSVLENRDVDASLLDLTRIAKADPASNVQRFLAAITVREAIEALCGSVNIDRPALRREIMRGIARIDDLLNRQLNAVLHHPAFQKLEASWRQLHWLVEERRKWDEESDRVKIRVLNISRREMERDFENAVDFDQSQIFKKVYEEEFGSPGGEPYGMLIGDFSVSPRVSAEHPHDDVRLLERLSGVAAAAFCPLITSATPALFGLEDFGGLQYRLRHDLHFQQLDLLKWRALREADDARFLGVALPRVLVRSPYREDSNRVDNFCFEEKVTGKQGGQYLWGTAAYALAAVTIRSFLRTGWLASIRGAEQGEIDDLGMLPNLPVDFFNTGPRRTSPRISTDVVITDEHERRLSELGFTPLCSCAGTEYSAFYSAPSLHQPKTYDTAEATQNARLSAQLPYVLCVSRFAHYLKVLGRHRVGAIDDPATLADDLNRWLAEYITPDAEASTEVKSRRPLRAGNVEVQRSPLDPGKFFCKIQLVPHFQLEGLTAGINLVTEIIAARVA